MRVSKGYILTGKQLALVAGLLLFICFTACNKDVLPPEMDQNPYPLILPAGFPNMDIPSDNKMTSARVEFGRLLFYDPLLSRDSSISCGSCHLQGKAFADNRSLAVGIDGREGSRNVPSLVNIGFSPYFFAEGGSPSLEAQVQGPIENEDEHGFNARELIERLSGNPFYENWSQKAYGRPMSLFVLNRALASFERTIVSANSPYDKAMQGDSASMSPQQWAGMKLFFSDRLACGSCHPAPLFTDYSIQNIGLYGTYGDKGRFRVTLNEEDKGKFKTPSLRNVALSAPYMHDGSKAKLSDVIDHFNTGGVGHPNQASTVRPLALSAQEKQNLLAFLVALTDKDVAVEPKWAP